MMRWFFCPKPPGSGILLGSDTTGKTTLLYQLKTGKTITTIPTMGFNIETIERGKRGDFTLWDMGGCDQMQALVRHYFRPDRFILFLHDCADTERIDYSISQLHSAIEMMLEFGTQHMWILLTKQDLIPLPEQQATVSSLRARFESEIKRYKGTPQVTIIDKLGMNALDSKMVHYVLDEIKATLDGANNDHDGHWGPAKAPESSYRQPAAEELLQRAKLASINEADAESFWQAFLDSSLDVWDHYVHLRTGYFVILQGLASGTGILGCADMFLEHLARLRSTNPQRFRNTAHRTMTTFWLAQIQIAILNFNGVEQGSKLPEREDFREIVLQTPILMDSSLWKAYYSKDVMFSPEARENWCFPDLRQLPAFTATPSQRQPATPSLESNSDRLLRFALIVVQASLISKLKRGSLVKQALQTLEVTTIRLRGHNNQILPYSETQSYFWIQIVHACLRGLDSGIVAPNERQSSETTKELAVRLDLTEFKSLFSITGEEWRMHYKDETWTSIAARREFALPDLKSLPNVISIPSVYRENWERLKEVRSFARSREELSRNEVMATVVATALAKEAELEKEIT